MRDEIILRAAELAAGYGENAVVRDVSFAVRPGEILTLIGPNGAGKSTILKAIAQRLKPLAGTVYLSEKASHTIDQNEIARKMSILSTDRVRTEKLLVRDVVNLGRYPYTGALGILSAQDHAVVERTMEQLGVSPLAERDFEALSDGQRQRVLFARALCQEPEVLVMDEPTSYLDVRYQIELLTLLQQMARERELAVVLSLHELELARRISDTVVCIRDGKIDRAGNPTEILTDRYIEELYLLPSGAYSGFFGRAETDGTDACYVRSGQKLLRCGYTTGTCAALAASAATRLLLTGAAPGTVHLRTPKGIVVEVPVAERACDGETASCAVRKDAGDDPDVTDGCLVFAQVRRAERGVSIDGGEGVGRVTKPGLDQPVGAAAINSTPRRMIAEAVETVCGELGFEGGAAVTISVPGGEEIAKKTFNPMLGVEGGISILGTSGIVEPMSEQAIIDTIATELRQRRAEGTERIVLTPGNYGADFLRRGGVDTCGVPNVRYSNYLGDALDLAVTLGFREALLVGHIGKLVKLAGGIMNTHSKQADCRGELFCAHAALCGADTEVCRTLMDAATTDACIAVLDGADLRGPVLQSMLAAMQRQLDHRAGGGMRTGAVTFSNEYGLLGVTSGAEALLRDWKNETEKD
ncbi:MAG: cobalamin biosynthesis protein CbiD [Ruminococcaceae bacterium]|nr:cobalamin biosynthesis protein CbiD [Oscillospiraceae bacterium]